nr:MAG TPA: hypothetical protein [Caudoviricetes sp.]
MVIWLLKMHKIYLKQCIKISYSQRLKIGLDK